MWDRKKHWYENLNSPDSERELASSKTWSAAKRLTQAQISSPTPKTELPRIVFATDILPDKVIIHNNETFHL